MSPKGKVYEAKLRTYAPILSILDDIYGMTAAEASPIIATRMRALFPMRSAREAANNLNQLAKEN